MSWSGWAVNESQSQGSNWNVYRAISSGGKWIYDEKQYSKSIWGDSQQLLTFLNTLIPAQSNNPYKQDNNDSMQQITDQFQGLGVGGPNPGGGYAYGNQSANNPYTNPYQNPYTPPITPVTPSRRGSATPGPTSSAGQGLSRRGSATPGPDKHRRTSSSSKNGSSSSNGSGLLGFQTPQQIASGIRRSATAAPPSGTKRPSERSQASSGIRNFKIVKPKDQRHFFKAGRIFKALWKDESSGSNNPFGEILRFLVVKPFKRHSICLAIHTYRDKGTTARHARARDHVVIYSEDEIPELVQGEDRIILRRSPVKVRLAEGVEHLASTARLNLAKLYTIEHNIPNLEVGKLSSRDVDNVRRWTGEVQGMFLSSTTDTPLDEDDEDE